MSALVACLVFAAACSGTSSGKATRAPRGHGHAPFVKRMPLTWTALHNPLYLESARAVKDEALAAAPDSWYLLFSAVDEGGAWRVGIARSRDGRAWSTLPSMPHDATVDGEGSPDVVGAPDRRFVVTYQSQPHDRAGAQSKLYYRTTTDFRHFFDARPLARELHPGANDRMIDAALAWTPAGLLLGYKHGIPDGPQAFELARSASGTLDGPWHLVGRPEIRVLGDTIENYQFFELDHRWQLLATSNVLNRPYLFALTGDPTQPSGWLHWSAGRQLEVPQEPWNRGSGATGGTYQHANSAYLVDQRTVDGHVYLVYEDAPNLTGFGGESHGVIAIARSTDLQRWTVPPS